MFRCQLKNRHLTSNKASKAQLFKTGAAERSGSEVIKKLSKLKLLSQVFDWSDIAT
jgi:hypothetical protein